MSSTEDKSVIQCIMEFIKNCPYLPDYRKSIGVDHLGPDVQSYMIEAVPCNPIVKRYVSGPTIRQFQFNFSSREPYTPDVRDSLDNSMFYEHFQNWLEECTAKKDFPILTGGKTVQKIMATTHGYVYDADQTKAQYMIQCNMIYYCP